MEDEGEPDSRYPAETIDRFIDVQEKELQFRGQELEIRRTEIEHNANFARASLDAQVTDRENERTSHDRIHRRNTLFGALALVVLVAGGIALAVSGKEAILFELLRVTIVFAGAYHWGRFNERKARENQS